MKKWLAAWLIVVLMCSALPGAMAAGDRMYLICDSDSRELTEAELWEWDYESLGYILNEIFARKGYDFIPGQQYDVYFRSLPWYKPNNSYDNNDTCYRQLNDIEWYNQKLVKKVRQQMRDWKNYNYGAKSVWDEYSAGFDVLQGFEYVEFKKKQTLAVFSAPSSSSWRGANGKAMVSANGAIFTDGAERGWLLVMYETNNGGVRVGYIDQGKVKGKVTGSAYYADANFSYQPAAVTASCVLTDDPARQTTQIKTLSAGEQVTYLRTYINRYSWAYIETTAPDGRVCRGFIPANCLDTGNEDTIGNDYQGWK